MSPATVSPHEKTQEDALAVLSRILLWGFGPLAIIAGAVRWLDTGTPGSQRAALLITPPFLFVAAFGWLLRPSPTRSLERRGWYAVLGVMFISGWGLLFNGPRAANTAGMATVLCLAVLFVERRRTFFTLVSAAFGIVLVGLYLRYSVGFQPAPEPQRFRLIFELASGAAVMLGLGLAAYVLWATLENYRRAQDALARRSAELLASQAEAQRLQQQELVARLSTVLAGEIAAQLDRAAADVAHVPTHEARMRASHALRLLESLGKPAAARATASVGPVLRRVEETIRPLLPAPVAIDIVDSSTGRPQLDPHILELVLVHLVLQVNGDGADTRPITVSAFDGLGDISRTDGRRTWSIIEIGRATAESPVTPPAKMFPVREDLSSLLVELVVSNAGGRFSVERRQNDELTCVLQLPSA